jgi:hypothetical protein
MADPLEQQITTNSAENTITDSLRLYLEEQSRTENFQEVF